MSTEGFDTFWRIYPRKVGKLAAQKAYEKALKLTSEQAIGTAVLRHAKECEGKQEEYIPHAATWLNQGRWTDERHSRAAWSLRPAPTFPREPTPEEWRRRWDFMPDPSRPGGHANVFVPATNKIYAALCERMKDQHPREYRYAENGIWVCGSLLR